MPIPVITASAAVVVLTARAHGAASADHARPSARARPGAVIKA
jgi:hypothetical protein